MWKRWNFRIGQQFTWERNFEGDFRKSFIQVDRKTICETKCTWRKESQLSKEIVGTGNKENKEYHGDIINENEVTNRVNAIDNDSCKSEEKFLEDFRTFKKSFLAEVNYFKKQWLTSYKTDNVNKSNNSDRLIILLEENIAFLKEQIKKKIKLLIFCWISCQSKKIQHHKIRTPIQYLLKLN